MFPTTDAAAYYLAAMIDGEGCVRFSRNWRANPDVRTGETREHFDMRMRRRSARRARRAG